jgi:arylsulfatase A-like enzyme
MSARPQPNVVFMLGDNIGWGALSCYGGTVKTPRLDRLAGEGIRLENYNTEARMRVTELPLAQCSGGDE